MLYTYPHFLDYIGGALLGGTRCTVVPCNANATPTRVVELKPWFIDMMQDLFS
jgi:hypothetical protein